MEADSTTVTYRYQLSFADGETRSFVIELDRESLAVIPQPRDRLPEWTRLGFKQCAGCPLEPATHERCPVAANLVDLVEFFQEVRSYEEVEVVVDFHGRRYSKTTSMQSVGSSLLGIIGASSGCPILDTFRPMVDTHLPFMTPGEAFYRVTAMYLFRQFFRRRQRLEPDWDLDGLTSFLEEVRAANAGLCERIRSIGSEDACLNAIAILGAQGELTRFAVRGPEMDRLQRLFDVARTRDRDEVPEP